MSSAAYSRFPAEPGRPAEEFPRLPVSGRLLRLPRNRRTRFLQAFKQNGLRRCLCVPSIAPALWQTLHDAPPNAASQHDAAAQHPQFAVRLPACVETPSGCPARAVSHFVILLVVPCVCVRTDPAHHGSCCPASPAIRTSLHWLVWPLRGVCMACVPEYGEPVCCTPSQVDEPSSHRSDLSQIPCPRVPRQALSPALGPLSHSP